jgi:preprotein translocase SecE subunit
MSVNLNSDNANHTKLLLDAVHATVDELTRPKMHWPGRVEAIRAVVAVLTLLAIGAGFVGLVDLVLSRILDPLLFFSRPS